MIKQNLIAFLTFAFLSLSAYADTPPIFSTANGAIEGYDPVAYFTQGKPAQGSNEFSYEWQGAIFKFSNPEHRELFIATPEKYAPQYGGYCAYAVSEGATAKTVPEAWSIVDNKLYLNYSVGVKKRWSEDIPGRIAKADKNWPKVLK